MALYRRAMHGRHRSAPRDVRCEKMLACQLPGMLVVLTVCKSLWAPGTLTV
jgi:hypothetical protein